MFNNHNDGVKQFYSYPYSNTPEGTPLFLDKQRIVFGRKRLAANNANPAALATAGLFYTTLMALCEDRVMYNGDHDRMRIIRDANDQQITLVTASEQRTASLDDADTSPALAQNIVSGARFIKPRTYPFRLWQVQESIYLHPDTGLAIVRRQLESTNWLAGHALTASADAPASQTDLTNALDTIWSAVHYEGTTAGRLIDRVLPG